MFLVPIYLLRLSLLDPWTLSKSFSINLSSFENHYRQFLFWVEEKQDKGMVLSM